MSPLARFAMLRRLPEFRLGFVEMLPLMPGTLAWGLMTGVSMAKSGLSIVEALAMGLLVFAGSSQLASLPLLVAGAPTWVVLATAFCVNLRFVVFSLHLRPYMMHLPLGTRLLTGYLTTDLSYVIHIRRYPQPPKDADEQRAQDAYLLGHCTCVWLCWMVPSLLGLGLANFIPTQWGLGFAGILCLVGIMWSLASNRLRLVSAAVAGATAVAAYALPLKLNIVLGIGVAVLACMALEGRVRCLQPVRVRP